MKEDVQAAWVADLESGEYPQGEGYLRVWSDDNQRWEYCCLGRLCEISGLGEWEERVSEEDDVKYSVYLDEKGYLPLEVAEWAGVDPAHHDNSVQYRLSEMNDGGKSFSGIADALPGVLAEFEGEDK